MNERLRAVCDLMVDDVRENAGRHEYDGVVQDLSPDGVRRGLARLGGAPERDAHDDAHLAAVEEHLRVRLGELEEHRWSPYPHLGNLDLSVYDREYAPAAVRADARRRHLAAWPDAVDAAVESLDRVSRPVATGLLKPVEGLVVGVDAGDEQARAVHARLVAHVRAAATDGDPDPALGAAALARLMAAGEATEVDLGRLAARADAERDRQWAFLREACDRLRPGADPRQLVTELLADHPSTPEVIYEEARAQIDEATAFTLEHDLIPDPDGVCLVGPAPPARRWAMAMMSWNAPYEDDGPSWYHVTPPDPSWPEDEQADWLKVFSRTTLPAITVHEVTPGHFAHGRLLRRAPGDVRRTLQSSAFVEGWAHYVEELLVEQGFRADDPRYAIGVAIEALLRVTRLAVAIGVHGGDLSMDDAVRRFEDDAFLAGPAARAEADRATFDPTYGRYTWGKLEILALRDEARARWGRRYSHRRFHEALLSLGAPPLGLMGAIFDDAP